MGVAHGKPLDASVANQQLPSIQRSKSSNRLNRKHSAFDILNPAKLKKQRSKQQLTTTTTTITTTTTNQQHVMEKKVVILGTQSSGKSTVYNFMRYLMEPQPSEIHSLLDDIRDLLVMNCIDYLRTVLTRFTIETSNADSDDVLDPIKQWTQQEQQEYSILQYLLSKDDKFIKNLQNMFQCERLQFQQFQQDSTNAIKLLPIIYYLYERQKRHHLTELDMYRSILSLHCPTLNVIESEMEWNQKRIQLIDHMGHIHARSTTWIQSTDGASLVFFCVSLTDYTDRAKIIDSLQSFRDLANHQLIMFNTRVILLFTHRDQFMNHLVVKDLGSVFPNISDEFKYEQDSLLNRPMSIHAFPIFTKSMNNNTITTTTTTTTATTTTILSTVILEHVFSYFTPRELVNVSFTNYQFYHIAGSDKLWSQLCRKFQPEIDHNEVRQFYVQKYLLANGGVKQSLMMKLQLNRQQQQTTTATSTTTATTTTTTERQIVKRMYKFYFELGGGNGLKAIKFIVDQYLQTVVNEDWRDELAKNVIVLNCLDVDETKRKLHSIFHNLTSSSCES